jgi:hypothetical protein
VKLCKEQNGTTLLRQCELADMTSDRISMNGNGIIGLHQQDREGYDF